MKKLSVIMTILLALHYCMPIQAKDIRGIVSYKSDGQPIVGASIVVQGTDIETQTDIDGRFALSDIPDNAKKIQISFIGMQTQIIKIEGKDEIMVRMIREERIITPFVRAGFNFSRPQSSEDNNHKYAIGMVAGAGVSFAVSHTLSITPSILFTKRNVKAEVYNPNASTTIKYEANPLYLTIPVTLDIKVWTKKSNKLVANVGPYVDFGLNGTYTLDGKNETDLFEATDGTEPLYKRTDVGIQAGLGGIIRHLYLGANVQLGLIKMDNTYLSTGKYNNFYTDISIGYYF